MIVAVLAIAGVLAILSAVSLSVWRASRGRQPPRIDPPRTPEDNKHPFLRCHRIDGGFACTRPLEEDK